MKNFNDIELNYKRHIRQARVNVRGYEGYARALKIKECFESVGHPHPDYTFNQVRFDNEGSRQTDKQFAINLMKEMAYLVATNEMLLSESTT